MVDRVSLPTALKYGTTLPDFLDAADPKVAYDWDFRLAGVHPDWTESGAGHQYSLTDGVNCGVAGLISLAGLDDTDLIGEGTILVEVERAALAFDGETYQPLTFLDAEGRTDAGEHPLIAISETGNFVKEIYVIHSAIGSGALSIACEGATDDSSQPARYFDRAAPDTSIDDRFAIVAITWKSGRVYVMIDGNIECSFQREMIDGDVDKISLGGRFSTFLGDYWIKRAQALNVCVAPKITAPKIAMLADSFCLRFTNRAAATAETLAGNLDVQGSLSYIFSEPDVLTTQRHTERIAQSWAQTNAFHVLQSIATTNYGIWPPLFNAGRNGAQWRSDLGGQINAAQIESVIYYDPEILWCFGSVNDISTADVVEDIVGDIQAILTTIISGCRNIRKIRFVETFATPETRATENIAATYAEHDRLRAKLATLDGFTVANAKGIDVSVEFIETNSQWADADGTISPRYGIGSHPDNTTDSAQGPGDTGDVHPTAEGMSKIAEILKPYFLSDLINR